MDEWELQEYIDQIDFLDDRLGSRVRVPDEVAIADQLRDEDGIRVPGCYRMIPKLRYVG